jgi:hypothetical protein
MGLTLSNQQVEHIRAATSLQLFRLPYMYMWLERLLAPPHSLQWRSVQHQWVQKGEDLTPLLTLHSLMDLSLHIVCESKTAVQSIADSMRRLLPRLHSSSVELPRLFSLSVELPQYDHRTELSAALMECGPLCRHLTYLTLDVVPCSSAELKTFLSHCLSLRTFQLICERSVKSVDFLTLPSLQSSLHRLSVDSWSRMFHSAADLLLITSFTSLQQSWLRCLKDPELETNPITDEHIASMRSRMPNLTDCMVQLG